MSKVKDIIEVDKKGETIIVKNGLGEVKIYEIIGRTEKGLYIGRNVAGLIECFSEFDIGKIRNVRVPNEEEGAGKYK